MTKHLLTSMSQVRYDELVDQWLDGSLSDKWKALEGKELTKKQQVEERQIRAIAMMMKLPEDSLLFNRDKRKWKQLNFYTENGKVFLEVIG